MALKSNKAYSKVPCIANIKALASILETTPEELVYLAENVEKFWKAGKVLQKKDGTPRHTHDAREPLKTIHEHIKNRLLKKVEYPRYILGGISDKQSPRDYKQHAELHSNKKVLITEDIKDFFPSTTASVVQNIWQCFFNFHPKVAAILTQLTTYQDSLPQGWKTSGYLANLALWDREPEFVAELLRQGLAYSRYMDDVTVSSSRPLNDNQKGTIISGIYGMLGSKNYRPKRSKHKISGKNERMEITGLNVNSKSPSLPKQKRNRIRTQVFQLEQTFKKEGNTVAYRKRWRTASGNVGTLMRFHPKEAKKLRDRLAFVKPKFK